MNPEERPNRAGRSLSVVLLAYGTAGIVGNLVAGWVTDRHPRRAALGTTIVLTVALAALAVCGRQSAGVTIAAVALWGAAFIAIPVCLQSAVVRVAPDAQDTASALYVVAFQIGIGGGALAGSVLVGAGQLGALPAVAAACSVIGCLGVLVSRRAFPARL